MKFGRGGKAQRTTRRSKNDAGETTNKKREEYWRCTSMYRLLSGDHEALEEHERENERIRQKEQEWVNELAQKKEEIENNNIEGSTCIQSEKHLDS